MVSDLLACLDLGTAALAAIVLGAVVLTLILFLRQNQKDLEVLEEELESESADNDEAANDCKPGNRL